MVTADEPATSTFSLITLCDNITQMITTNRQVNNNDKENTKKSS